jgi:hypothetical protein
VAFNFQTGNNRIKLLTGYERVTQKVLWLIESILQNAKQLQHTRLSLHLRSASGIQLPFPIIGHGNPDNNLESHCTSQKSGAYFTILWE